MAVTNYTTYQIWLLIGTYSLYITLYLLCYVDRLTEVNLSVLVYLSLFVPCTAKRKQWNRKDKANSSYRRKNKNESSYNKY